MSLEAGIARIASARRGVVVASAGCGKTHAIAEAVALNEGKPQLILTHTYAGISALRNRLKRLGVHPAQYRIYTIAHWALKYASHYPTTSALPFAEPARAQWSTVYPAAEKVLQLPAIRAVLTASFGGVYVDEYQDCTLAQHKLVLRLADALPCRIFGDPLQGIFDFGKEEPIHWARDVYSNFECLPELTVPWRWRGENTLLGHWLLQVRKDLLAGKPIDITTAPVKWCAVSREAQRETCYRFPLGQGETVIALVPGFPAEAHSIARESMGIYKSIEPMDCSDLRKFAKQIQELSGTGRLRACTDFARTCVSNIGSTMDKLVKWNPRGRTSKRVDDSFISLVQHAERVKQGQSLSCVMDFLLAVRILPKARLYREELWFEMQRALQYAALRGDSDLEKAAWVVRNVTRQVGRRDRCRIVSRTLLVKGLEFDHAILLNADRLDVKNLYVALTRARKSITILSKNPVLTPHVQELAQKYRALGRRSSMKGPFTKSRKEGNADHNGLHSSRDEI